LFPPPSSLHLRAARNALLSGEVIACPTEAVWGLSCDPYDPGAVLSLLSLKNRSVNKGLILVASSEEQLDFILADFSLQDRSALSVSWPGPVTWLVEHRNRVPPWISGGHETVALRVSAHPGMRALCAAFGGPLVSTSANPAGARPARELFQVRRYFGGRLGYILPGRLGTEDKASEIRSLASGEIIRA
jgi:L-threonylcarbamoyladenylate synthase